jgi:Ig-like domain-containing protein/PEP-CTERM motif-containing protein
MNPARHRMVFTRIAAADFIVARVWASAAVVGCLAFVGRVQADCLFPEISKHPQSQTVSVGSDVTFYVEVKGTEPFSYQWQKNSELIVGATDPSFSILHAILSDAGEYRVICANSCGIAQSDPASLIVVLEGDYNGNGIVDAADYTVWRDTLGSTSDLRANGDDTGASAGVIDLADFTFWKAHLGEAAGSGFGGKLNVAVPEPATLVLLMLAATGWCFQRAGRRVCPTRIKLRPGPRGLNRRVLCPGACCWSTS